MIFLHKILPLFVMPLMIYLFVIILGTKKEYKNLIYISSLIFYFISTPIFSNFLMKKVEGEYSYKSINEIEKADAIVILSGIMRINEFDDDYTIEWGVYDGKTILHFGDISWCSCFGVTEQGFLFGEMFEENQELPVQTNPETFSIIDFDDRLINYTRCTIL